MKRLFIFRVWNHNQNRMAKTTTGVWRLYEFIREEFPHCTWNDVELLQFSGRIDLEGHRIYEGDIIKTSGEHKRKLINRKKASSPWYKIAVVSYDESKSCFMTSVVRQENAYFGDIPSVPFPMIWDDLSDYTVVGNIYENPELCLVDREAI